MSWHNVYLKLKRVLEDPEFKKKNIHSKNPVTPDDAIVVALYHLNQEYSEKATDMCRKEYGL
jgi:hypothetical protein